MTYAMSDIHGCFDAYWKMLRRIGLRDEDTLYVLGDAIDRGPKSLEVVRDIMRRPNVVPLLGNHELNAIRALPSVLEIVNDGRAGLTEQEYADLQLWLYNGGGETIRQLTELDGDRLTEFLRYFTVLKRHVELEVGGRKFVLVHTGPENFSPSRPLDDYSDDEMTFSRPGPETRYFEDRMMVFGHTPTGIMQSMRGEPATPGRIFHADTYMDIDCGVVFAQGGGRLGCLCLDTMEEFYEAHGGATAREGVV